MTKSEQEAAKIDFRKEITIKLFSEAHIEKCRRKFAELSDEEFVALMRKAYELDADPLVGDIYIRRRQRGDTGGFTVMATIACMRNYADRTGEYAGDDLPLLVLERGKDEIVTDKPLSCIVVDPAVRSPINPKGIVYCTLGVYRLTGGAWRRHSHTVLWDDYVPLNNGKLEPASTWATIPHVMISKVAEVGALRKAFPKLGAIFIEEEMTKATRDSDSREAYPAKYPLCSDPRVAAPSAPSEQKPPRRGNVILTNMLDGGPLREIPAEEYGRTILKFLSEALENDPAKVIQWFRSNTRAREEFWHLDQELSGRKDAVAIKAFETAAMERLKAREAYEKVEVETMPPRRRMAVPRSVRPMAIA